MARFPVNALRRALAERLASAGRFGGGVAKYGAVTGGIGGAVGAGIGYGSEPDDPWAGARDGAINGAMIGPVTVPATALGAASGLIPVAGTGILAHTLWSGDQGSRRTRARESLSEADAFAQMVREQQEAEFQRIMQARFGGPMEERAQPSLREVLGAQIEPRRGL